MRLAGRESSARAAASCRAPLGPAASAFDSCSLDAGCVPARQQQDSIRIHVRFALECVENAGVSSGARGTLELVSACARSAGQRPANGSCAVLGVVCRLCTSKYRHCGKLQRPVIQLSNSDTAKPLTCIDRRPCVILLSQQRTLAEQFRGNSLVLGAMMAGAFFFSALVCGIGATWG